VELVIARARGRCPDLDPGRSAGPELDGVGGRGSGEQLGLAILDDEPTVEAEVELDPPAGIAAPSRPGGSWRIVEPTRG